MFTTPGKCFGIWDVKLQTFSKIHFFIQLLARVYGSPNEENIKSSHTVLETLGYPMATEIYSENGGVWGSTCQV